MRMTLLCLFTILFPAFSQQENSDKTQVREQFIEILDEKGVEAALAYMDQYLFLSQDEKTIYYIGWAEFLRGNYPAALAIADFLERETTQEALLGATFFMKGQVFIYDDDPQTDPFPSLELSLRIYQKLNRPSSVYKSYLGMASAALSEQDVNKTERYLILAFRTAVKHDLELSLYHAVAYRLKLALGDYEAAKEHLISELSFYKEQKDEVRIRIVHLHLATVCLVQGRKDEAIKYNEPALAFFQNINDKIRIIHGHLNLYFIENCEGSYFGNDHSQDDVPNSVIFMHDLLRNHLCPE